MKGTNSSTDHNSTWCGVSISVGIFTGSMLSSCKNGEEIRSFFPSFFPVISGPGGQMSFESCTFS